MPTLLDLKIHYNRHKEIGVDCTSKIRVTRVGVSWDEFHERMRLLIDLNSESFQRMTSWSALLSRKKWNISVDLFQNKTDRKRKIPQWGHWTTKIRSTTIPAQKDGNVIGAGGGGAWTSVRSSFEQGKYIYQLHCRSLPPLASLKFWLPFFGFFTIFEIF